MFGSSSTTIRRISLLFLCWSFCAILSVFVVVFLIQKRAELAIASLRSSIQANTESNHAIQVKNLNHIFAWLKLKAKLHNNTELEQFLQTSFESFSLLLNKSLSFEVANLLSCEACGDKTRQNLKLYNDSASLLNKNIKNILFHTALIERLNLEIAQRLKRHQLLAKDFENLVGSPSAYSSDSNDKLLYFASGPFKWLPLLDTTKVKGSESSGQIQDFSAKLESLRSQSKTVVEDYISLQLKLKESLSTLDLLNLKEDTIRAEIGLILLAAYTAELSF